MNFPQVLKQIEGYMTEDQQSCLFIISSQHFIHRLFNQEIRMFSQMLQRVLQKKAVQISTKNLTSNAIRPDVVLACYSVIVYRSNAIKVRHENICVSKKGDQLSENLFNVKFAIQILLKILVGLPGNDERKKIIAGLLLQIKGFKNYNAIIAHIHPDYISEQTLNHHIQNLKIICPNLLDEQLNKHKNQWFKYLQDKPISLAKMNQFLSNLRQEQNQKLLSQPNLFLQSIDDENAYILNRLKLIEESNEVQHIDIEDITTNIDAIYAEIILRINEIAHLAANKKNERMKAEYSDKQFHLKLYIKLLSNIMSIVNALINCIGMNWLRKISWLFHFVANTFNNFTIKGNHIHESIALQYSKVINLMITTLTSYLTIFKNGMIPAAKLQDLVLNQEYSIYKLIQALLYNDYTYDENQALIYQNYQKQKKQQSSRIKAALIEKVNFSMKSLNINPNWDSILVRIIPNIKNSLKFSQKLLHSCLFFFLKYYEITSNFENAAKFILMISNAKNSIFTKNKNNNELMRRIKRMIYPERNDVKEGLQLFCEEYFNEYVNFNQKDAKERLKKIGFQNLDYSQEINLHFGHQGNKPVGKIKRTESQQAILDSWEISEAMKGNSSAKQSSHLDAENHMLNSGQLINNELFYSVHEGAEKEIQQKINGAMKAEIQQARDQENQILLPDF